jgi:CarboxypepD_reg-like domain
MQDIIITGRIIDSATQKPLSNAKIFLEKTGAGTMTGGKGDFIITAPVEPGTQIIKCSYPAYRAAAESLEVLPDKTQYHLAIRLQKEKTKLEEGIKPPPVIISKFTDKKGEQTEPFGSVDQPIPVQLNPVKGKITPDINFWKKIAARSIRFDEYRNLMDSILNCNLDGLYDSKKSKKIDKNHLPFNRSEAYSLLKFATERYIEKKMGFSAGNDLGGYLVNGRIPYYDLILQKINEFLPDSNAELCEDGDGGFMEVVQEPILLELIWSYWHEEGMQVQTMNALSRRFQNIRNGTRDPLANLEIDPLRPLNNILWGYIQDAQHRLTISRRAYEYNHHYGIRLLGSAITDFAPADSRSRFIQAYHNLLYRCAVYFKEADDMTINADAFPVLNALREVHLLLAEGAHNQFGDLPTVSRIEMLMEQWILARPEIREFLGGRIMVPYDEVWMDKVDTMKTLQGWPETSISYYHELAVHGEQIVLSVRYGNWSQINDRDFARNWADFWRDSIQRYIHSYHSVTGVDLGTDSFEQSTASKAAIPAVLIQKKFERERLFKRG